jgi:hypothetical protein
MSANHFVKPGEAYNVWKTTGNVSATVSSSLTAPPEFSAIATQRPPCSGKCPLALNLTAFDQSNSSGTEVRSTLDSSSTDTNMAILISLIVMIVILSGVLAYLIVPLIARFIDRRRPVDPRKVNARYETIEGWLISKVCNHISWVV